ncbi:MAG: hypothetical protein V2I36_10550 [Desulfopila sp.]|jgi:hypothetical protein|nr:hypothetical protein [Desulfopila sp.]
MKKRVSSVLSLIVLLFHLQNFAATAAASQTITMNIPEAVIADALEQVLPLTLDDTSSRLEGRITLQKISQFKLLDNLVSFHLDLHGENLSLITTVASQDIRLKLGSAQLDFDCDAYLRFDEEQQILFVKPMARDIQPEVALQQGDIGNALLLLLNGREFPLELQEITPIIAETHHKQLSITAVITNIISQKGALQLQLKPLITASPRQN